MRRAYVFLVCRVYVWCLSAGVLDCWCACCVLFVDCYIVCVV